ncbi:aldehyde dehydrogenase family protein [Sphingomonas sp. UV9]|uniref:aldehyde dehydrogenase family protein n=1 Tax=Sphingomonas sp. UV9 TaxID=1851410 RepID=UPI000FFB1657|nr:aldehyde dehydrogenase family protein [Sphingomonas sp. UV9]RXD04789.1 aldehyde dehydrogenase family protein [Sphingomonas sp. UV9]
MRSYLQQYIAGEWVNSDGGSIDHVINPSTEQRASEIVLGTPTDVNAAVAAARNAFASYSRTSIEERLALIRRIITEFEARIPDLAAVISAEVGSPIDFVRERQAPFARTHFTGMLDTLATFEFSEQLADVRVVHEPIGVVALITPWNWPLLQMCAKIVPALAAGNTIVLKPSRQAPGAAVILAEILAKAGVPAGVFNLVQGEGSTIGDALSRHPDVDMVSFTGSTGGGIAVAKAAADTVKRVHQELGGKGPNLVLQGADLPTVLPPTIEGVLENAGQSCIAPTRLLVHRSQTEETETILKAIFDATKVDAGGKPGDHMGPVINESQFDKIQSLIQSAIDEGATLVAGGPGRPDGRPIGYFVRPTILTGVTPEMRIFREEIFGPVATLTVYDDLEEAITLANDSDFGLSATISGDPAEAARIVPRNRAGLVAINGWLGSTRGSFGGYKMSGNGYEGGKYGLADFLLMKSIVGEAA